MIVVVPTNRSVNLGYLQPLIDRGVRFIIVDDSEGSIHIDHPQFEVYNWGHRRRMLGDLEIGFPKRNGASRDFGFYVAWHHSDPGEIIVALDDDCEVYHDDFVDRVEDVLSDRPRPVADCNGVHLNILDAYGRAPGLFPRGFPYSARVDHDPMRLGQLDSRHVAFNLGLWTGVFDINAVDKIAGPAYEHPEARLRHESVIVGVDRLVSVCSMNMQFRRELIPAVYQLPMHVETLPGWVIDRYGDIWGGFILKVLMDLQGDAMAVGEPMINHVKAGDFVRNIWQEHLCHLVNDEFVQCLLEVREELSSSGYADMMCELAERLRGRLGTFSPLLDPYMRHLCDAMDAWNAALSRQN